MQTEGEGCRRARTPRSPGRTSRKAKRAAKAEHYRRSRSFGTGAHFLQYLEQGNEDRHLKEQGQATGNGVEADLCINLLHFLGLTLLVVSVLFLDLLDARRELLHSIRRADLLLHKGEQDKTENKRHDDDRQTPVGNETIHSIDAPEYGVFKRVPHVYLCPLGSGVDY